MLRILIATDLSPAADLALRRAIAFASANGASLRVVHVTALGTPEGERAALRERLHQRWRELAPPDLVEAGVAVPTGDPVETILAEAESYEPELIVLGAHGKMRLRDAWLGTTAERIMRGATVPVLVVRRAAGEPYRRVLAAVDDTTVAGDVLRLACRVSGATDVFAVHAFHVPFGAFVGGDQVHQEVEAEHRRAIETLVAEVAPDTGSVSLHPTLREGDSFGVIAEAVRELEPDLLVLGTHGRRGIAAALVDSVAEGALDYFDLDMMVLRTGGGESLTEL